MSREQALELAERMVSFSRGVFDLGLIGAPTPVDQRWLLAGLRERLGAGTALLEVAADTLGQDPLAELRRLPAADVLAVFGLHADHLALFKALNIQRDQLVAARPIPWLLLGHPAGIRSLAERAPDFVDFASFRELVDAPEGPPPSASTLEIRAAPELFGDPLLDRMWLAGEWDGLVQRLHHAVVARPDEPKAKMQLASLLLRRGEVEEARRHLQAAGDAWERLGDVHSRALTMGQIADILQARGQLDEALRIRKEEELPVYERLGDVRSRAVTMGMIADILQARGQLDDALRIRKEEELPVYERLGDVRSRAVTMGKIADILEDRGQLDEALRIRKEEELPVYTRLGDVRSRAVTMGQIANILQARGQLDDALRIRKEEELPVYERLGDVRSRAVTMGKIADILQDRGQLDDALRIRKEEQLPVYERLGDVRERAVTMGKIADILEDRGQLDDALRIRKEEQLPVYERLGDVRSRAVTMGKIADILQARGQLDEALRIRKEEELPVYERLGDVRELLVARAKTALLLLDRQRKEDVSEAHGHLLDSLAAARKYGFPVEAGQIEGICRKLGLPT